MRVKQDAVPGIMVRVWFEPTVTPAEMRAKKTNDTFSYEIGCAQLCGLGHYRMKGFLTIHTQDEYDAWMAARQEEIKPKEGEEGDQFWG
jgi:cytochrome c oxidase subunit 2